MTTRVDQSLPDLAGGDRLTVLLGDERDAGEPWHKTAVGLLASQGVRTVIASGGRDALERIERGVVGQGPRIHVAVLEQRMPGMSGLQVLKRLHDELVRRADAVIPPVIPPAILVAEGDRGGGVSRGLMHDALVAHCFSVLPRPVETDLLLDTLARAVRRHYADRWPGRP